MRLYQNEKRYTRNVNAQKEKGVFAMSKNTTFDVYTSLDALVANDVIRFDFDVDTKTHKVVDNSNIKLLFALQNSEHYNVTNVDDARLANKDFRRNYVCMSTDDDSSVLQFWGKSNKGEVVIEVRKHLFDTLELASLKVFREWGKEVKGGKAIERCFVCKSDKDVVTFCKAFFARLEKRKTNVRENVQVDAKDA